MGLFSHTPPRIAIVHEWLTGMRGGEKCVEALCELFPGATLFTLVHVRGSVSPTIERMPIHTSFIQHLPLAARHYRHYLPLFPRAIERLNLREFDIVISSNHAVAKGVRTAAGTLHICYCHTPMRYIWNLYDEYFSKGSAGLLTRTAMRLFVKRLRAWDVRTAAHPHHYIANSRNVQRRIKEIYHREADVIYPPVDTSLFQLSTAPGNYYLIVSALVPYKRIDLAIEAFNSTDEKLVIIGSGPEGTKLRALAGPNIEFLGWQPDDIVRKAYAECTALVFPGEEDFGIVPLEAMASGKPVVAFARGGALETVVQTAGLQTGVLFQEQSPEHLLEALQRLRTTTFHPDLLRKHALQFDKEIYKKRMLEYIQGRWEEFSRTSRKLQTQ